MADAPGEVELCNYALGILGGAANSNYPWIDTLDAEAAKEDTKAAVRWCQIFLPRARDEIQSAWDWMECTRFAKMGAALSSTSVPSALTVPGYEYCYARPTCLTFRGIVSNDVDEVTGAFKSQEPYLELGEQIACNIDNDDDDPDYLFRFNLRVTDVTKWSPALFKATGHLLAVYLARPMAVPVEGQAYLRKLYERVYDEARASCQKRLIEPGSRPTQRGDSVELSPGIIDYSFPQPS